MPDNSIPYLLIIYGSTLYVHIQLCKFYSKDQLKNAFMVCYTYVKSLVSHFSNTLDDQVIFDNSCRLQQQLQQQQQQRLADNDNLFYRYDHMGLFQQIISRLSQSSQQTIQNNILTQAVDPGEQLQNQNVQIMHQPVPVPYIELPMQYTSNAAASGAGSGGLPASGGGGGGGGGGDATRTWIGPGHEISAGFYNDTHNLCFMNAVLQCMLRSPNMDKVLETAIRGSNELLHASFDLFNSLSSRQPISTERFRCAASKLPSSPILVKSQRQPECDVGEFYTWLFAAWNDPLAKITFNDPKIKFTQKEMETLLMLNIDRSSMSDHQLAVLRFTYKECDNNKMEALNDEYFEEVKQHGRLDEFNTKVAENMELMSDLNWLAYKDANSRMPSNTSSDGHTMLDDLFTGQSLNIQMCSSCNEITMKFDVFKILPLPIYNGASSLQECLKEFCCLEEFNNYDGFKCDNCDSTTNKVKFIKPAITLNSDISCLNVTPYSLNMMSPIAPPIGKRTQFPHARSKEMTSTPKLDQKKEISGQRLTMLRHLPQCLVIQLMRFENTGNNSIKKLTTHINIPLENLDISDLLFHRSNSASFSNTTGNYELYAIISHIGSTPDTGHYISYVKCELPKRPQGSVSHAWYQFNNEKLRLITDIRYEILTPAIRDNAYLLFYKRPNLRM